MNDNFSIKANLVDILNKEIYAAQVFVNNGNISSITRIDEKLSNYILPGFIDAHVHIESSMLMPSEFARIAVLHGTVGTVSDPHEIANVLGEEGINHLINNALQTPFYCCFGLPSCVPATSFETAGAIINASQVERLIQMPHFYYLSEMMNYPGVLQGDNEVMAKILATKNANKPIDGHAPGLTGHQALAYIAAGISTDHECYTYQEGFFKAENGMKILIREGSAAKNFEALIDLIDHFAEQIMFCSDDKHPDDLMLGHINQLVIRALEKGKNIFDVLLAACINPILHYKLPIGFLQIGQPADFIVVNNLKQFNILETYIRGKKIAAQGVSYLPFISSNTINNFNIEPILKESIAYPMKKSTSIHVIEAIENQLITQKFNYTVAPASNFEGDLAADILKIVNINRYQSTKPAIAFIKNFGLQRGAIASTVAHDCHNILAIGTNDSDLEKVINLIISNKGGIAAVDKNEELILPLPVGGIMSNKPAEWIADQYKLIDAKAKLLGTKLKAPFMTLSFMALLVIPNIKLSDKGLFDGQKFEFI
jgi:adenine deaminase